jgi:hypothetical protein
MPDSDKKKNFLSHQQCAVIFGVEPRTVTKWSNEYGMPKVGRGKYNLIEVVQWRCNYLEKKIRELEMGGPDAVNQKARLNRIIAETKELQLAKLRGTLVDLNEIMPIITHGLNDIRQTSTTFAQKISPQLEGMDLSERSEFIKDSINELFKELTNIPDALRRSVSVAESSPAESVLGLKAASKDDDQRTRGSKKDTKRRKRSS